MKNFLLNLKVEQLYLIFMATVGVLLVFLTPPFQTPDEMMHFSRAYQISEGIIRDPAVEQQTQYGLKIYPHASQPYDFLSLLSPEHENLAHEINYYGLSFTRKLFDIPIDYEKRIDVSIPNTGLYSPVVYVPQALFAFLTRNIFDSVGAVYYATRLGAFIFSVICIFISMKLLLEKNC